MPPRPPPASLLASATPWRRHAAPSGLSQLPPVLIPFSCSPSRSAPRTRTEPSPPTPFAAATIPLSPPRRLPELRSASLDLLDVSRDQKGPEQPPSTSSPSFGPGAVLRRIRPLRRAPEPTDPPYSSAVSLCADPLSLPSCLRALGHSSVETETSPAPDLSPSSFWFTSVQTEHAGVLRALPGVRSTPQPLLPCSLTPTPSSPELRPPPRSPSAPIPAAPSATDSTRSFGSSPAPPRCPPRPIWSPEWPKPLSPPR